LKWFVGKPWSSCRVARLPQRCAAWELELVRSHGSRARWRAVAGRGITGALPLARSSDVVTWPRSRALRGRGEVSVCGRAELAGGWMAMHRCGYQLARSWLSVCGRVDARELSEESRVVVNPRAVGGRSHLGGNGGVKFVKPSHTSPYSRKRFLTMQSTRRRNRLLAQTGQYGRRALLRR
jgi:hypothetical protein